MVPKRLQVFILNFCSFPSPSGRERKFESSAILSLSLSLLEKKIVIKWREFLNFQRFVRIQPSLRTCDSVSGLIFKFFVRKNPEFLTLSLLRNEYYLFFSLLFSLTHDYIAVLVGKFASKNERNDPRKIVNRWKERKEVKKLS